MVVETPKYQQDPRLLQARVNLARHLGLAPDDVTISIGHKETEDRFVHRINSPSDPEAPTEDIVITIHKPGYDIEPERLKEELRAQLAQLPPLSDVAQMVPEVEEARTLVAELKRATAGTSFDQKLLEWPGFDPETHKKGTHINDYALEQVRANAYGVEIDFNFPADEGSRKKATLENFAEVTRGRTDAIKDILLERLRKYNAHNIMERGLNAEERSHLTQQAEGKTPEQVEDMEKAALKQKIAASEALLTEELAKLEINIRTERNRIVAELRSPEQAAAHKEAKEHNREWDDPSNADELRNTNPLTSLIVGLTSEPTPATDDKPEKSPQLHKALARAFLFDKDKNPVPDFVEVAGRKDIQTALVKEMTKVLKDHPEKGAEFQKIIASDLFKNHNLWHGSSIGEADVAKPYPRFEKTKGENDTVSITFPVRKDANPDKNQLKRLIEGLAGIAPEGPQQQPAPAPVPQERVYPLQPQEEPAPATQQAATQQQPGSDDNPYRSIARDIITLHQQRTQGGWGNRTREEQEASTGPRQPG